MLLIAEEGTSLEPLRRELSERGAAVEVRELGDDFAAGARRLAAEIDAGTILVCDCRGERGCERAFFACRDSTARTVVLLAVGAEAECEAVEVLAAALRKAMPQLRLAVVTDRVDEAARPSGAERRTQPAVPALAELLVRVAADADSWSASPCFRV